MKTSRHFTSLPGVFKLKSKRNQLCKRVQPGSIGRLKNFIRVKNLLTTEVSTLNYVFASKYDKFRLVGFKRRLHCTI